MVDAVISTPVATELAIAMVARHEGYRKLPYRDTLGILTIGHGRNLESNGISRGEALVLLSNDLVAIERELSERLDFWGKLDNVRQAALLDMGMMGVARLLRFNLMLDAMRLGNWEEAAKEALSSLWAREVGSDRSHYDSEMIRTGMVPA